MSNYQLYRTNVKLGGQVKWDLKIESIDDDLYISDFKLSPISDYVAFNRYEVGDYINYSILENLKAYHKKISGSFYQECIDPTLSTLEPYMISGDEERSQYKDMHNSVYEMGLKRANYSVHGKQFEFLCPVWLESTPNEMFFVLKMRTPDKDGIWRDICKKTVHLIQQESSTQTYHEKFSKRFVEYLNTISPDNNCIKVDLQNQEAYITGIDTSTGLIKTTSLLNLPKNLIRQERLMMDFDNLLLQEYENRNMIVKQLINFNFIFDLDEIVPASLRASVLGQDVTIGFDIVVDGQTLEKRDMDCRYDYIPCINSDGSDSDINVYREICDNLNVDLTTTNRIQPSITHWSLADQEDYIFNLYPGYGGIIDVADPNDTSAGPDYKKLKKVYGNAADTFVDPTNSVEAKQSNSTNWIWWAQEEITNVARVNQMKKKEASYYEQGGELLEWVHNIHHKQRILLNEKSDAPVHIVFIKYNANKCSESLRNMLASRTTEGDGVLYELSDDSTIYFSGNRFFNNRSNINQSSVIVILVNSNALQWASFIKFKKIIDDYINSGWHPVWMKQLQKWMNETIHPDMYRLDDILGYMRADGPALYSTEVQHYKTSSQPEYLLRYDGKIKPAMMSIADHPGPLFTKEIILKSDLADSVYSEYNPYGYEKKYPSIGYYSFERHDLQEIDGKMLLDKSDPSTIIDFPYEYKWFNESNCIYVQPSETLYISTTNDKDDSFIAVPNLSTLLYKYEDGILIVVSVGDDQVVLSSDSIKELIILYLSLQYNITIDKARYIYSLYRSKIDWEYASLTDVNNYIYTIKLNLK